MISNMDDIDRDHVQYDLDMEASAAAEERCKDCDGKHNPIVCEGCSEY